MSIEGDNQKERQRITRMIRAVDRNTLKESVRQNRTLPVKTRLRRTFIIPVEGAGRLGYTADGLAAMVQRRLLARATKEALQQPAQVHVKNGRPLTAKGAYMLGVPWNGDNNVA
jgi:hypothetical protein